MGRRTVPIVTNSITGQSDEAKRLWIVFKDSKKTQNEFAKLLGLTQSNLSRKLNGERPLDFESIKIICQKLGYSPEWFVLGTGPKKATGKDASLVTDIGMLRSEVSIVFNKNKAMELRIGSYEKELAELKELIKKQV